MNMSLRTWFSKFLDNKPSPKPIVQTVSKLPFFFAMPFYSNGSTTQINNLVSTLSSFFPGVDFNPSMSNSFTIASFFRFKDRLPSE